LNISIKQMIETSLIDWEGKIVSTLFVPSCNFRCPYCYNCDLILHPENFPDISHREINNYLLERKDFIDGICMSGGEPTLYPDLSAYFRGIKSKGFLIKLDTNGTNPKLLKNLIDFGLVDYIAMDIKSSLDFDNYSKETIVKIARYISGVKKYVLQNFSPLEKTLEPSFQKLKPYSAEKIQELSEKARKYVPNCCWR